jgi:hypothetical protein
MTPNGTDFSAAPSAAGYFYQARLALVLCLRHVNTGTAVEIGIERLDDVSLEADGTPFELLQTKHHLNRTASLSDHSVDLWKTLRIWSEATQADSSLPQRTCLVLVTTDTTAEGQAAARLRSPHLCTRDPVAAADTLTRVAENGKNAALQAAYAAFLALTPKMRIALLSAVEVLDGHAALTELDQVIESGPLRLIAPRGKAAQARELLEGWWWPRICAALMEKPSAPISILEVEAKLDDIRDQMKRNALVADYEHADLPDAHDAEYEGRPFVRQLKAIGVGGNRIQFAKRDFYRAFAQRSKWLREHPVLDGEIGNFETTLIEEWQPRFERMGERHADDPADSAALRHAGQDLYQWVESDARFPFRTQVHCFLNVGSYHMLANDLRVGWHRDFADLCKDEES